MTLRTSFVASALKLTILAIGHWFRWQSSFTKPYHQPQGFASSFLHICLNCRPWRNSFLHVLQNSQVICCTCCHLLFEYASGLLNSPGGGLITSVFHLKITASVTKSLHQDCSQCYLFTLTNFFLKYTLSSSAGK